MVKNKHLILSMNSYVKLLIQVLILIGTLDFFDFKFASSSSTYGFLDILKENAFHWPIKKFSLIS